MTPNKRSSGGARPTPDGDLRDPAYRRRYIFGDEPEHPRHRATLLGDFLFFGALLRR